jgi:hypothetical protein
VGTASQGAAQRGGGRTQLRQRPRRRQRCKGVQVVCAVLPVDLLVRERAREERGRLVDAPHQPILNDKALQTQHDLHRPEALHAALALYVTTMFRKVVGALSCKKN